MKKVTVLCICILITTLFFVSVAFADDGFSKDPIAINDAAKSVLMLEVYDAKGNLTGTASGFVAFNNRTLVTNYHVIEDADSIIANSDDGYQYMINNVLIYDEVKDIAIVSFFSPTDLIPLRLSENKSMMRAETVVAIGSPKGITNSVSTGIIGNMFIEDGVKWIQFTAPISPGSSGGALFNEMGEVIGITSGSLYDSQNVNLAVDITEVVNLYSKWDGNTRAKLSAVKKTATPSVTATPKKTAMPKRTATPKPSFDFNEWLRDQDQHSTPAPTYEQFVIITGNCNMREGPGTDYAIVGHAYKGEVYSYKLAKKDASGSKWYKIICDGQERYVSATYSTIIKEWSDTRITIGD